MHAQQFPHAAAAMAAAAQAAGGANPHAGLLPSHLAGLPSGLPPLTGPPGPPPLPGGGLGSGLLALGSVAGALVNHHQQQQQHHQAYQQQNAYGQMNNNKGKP